MQPKRLSVLGVGLLGGSLGLAVKKAAVRSCIVAGYGHRTSTLNTALKRGAIDEAYDDPAAAVRGADLVVLCTPVGLLGDLLDRIVPALEPEALVTDVGSTKRRIVAHAATVLSLGAGPKFVGSHPMAGSEKRGVEHAQADLFESAVCILTPDEATDSGAVDAIEAFWRSLTMRTTRMSPAEHDRRIADVSHVPHAVAAALVRMQERESLLLAGRGFIDSTRIASGDAGLWRDIFLENRENVARGVRELHDQLHRLLALLENEEADAVKRWLDEATETRERVLGQRTG